MHIKVRTMLKYPGIVQRSSLAIQDLGLAARNPRSCG